MIVCLCYKLSLSLILAGMMKANCTLMNQSCAHVDGTYKMISSIPTASFNYGELYTLSGNCYAASARASLSESVMASVDFIPIVTL